MKTRSFLQRTSIVGSLLLLFCMLSAGVAVAEEKIDASDPTKIYTYAGGGIKYTDYTNGDIMWELRATGNIGVTTNDMVLFELGYGWHYGDISNDTQNEDDLTNGRLRWFHLFSMDYSVLSGYRGVATQLDLQLAGNLTGTDGQNVVTMGVLPAFGLNEKWSLFVPVNWVNSFDKRFENYNGMGVGIAPLLVYSADWWAGSYLQIWPNYTYFFTNELSGDGSGNIDVTTGGQITETLLWSATVQKNLDKDLDSFRRGRETGVKNDWNIFINITRYF